MYYSYGDEQKCVIDCQDLDWLLEGSSLADAWAPWCLISMAFSLILAKCIRILCWLCCSLECLYLHFRLHGDTVPSNSLCWQILPGVTVPAHQMLSFCDTSTRGMSCTFHQLILGTTWKGSLLNVAMLCLSHSCLITKDHREQGHQENGTHLIYSLYLFLIMMSLLLHAPCP